MVTYEFEGKTTEEAIENASNKLNLPVEELNIDIIEPGSAGIFGLVGSKKAKIKVTFKETDGDTMDRDTTDGDTTDGDTTDGDLKMAKECLEKILALIPVEATVTGKEVDHTISLSIEGDRSGLLIGRKGKTLDALQFIVNKILSKTLEKRVKVVIDSENYRQRRKESLIQMAMRFGDKAKRTRKTVTTNPLNPRERRIIHLALKEDQQLDTKSRGEGMLKKVMIIPKK